MAAILTVTGISPPLVKFSVPLKLSESAADSSPATGESSLPSGKPSSSTIAAVAEATGFSVSLRLIVIVASEVSPSASVIV